MENIGIYGSDLPESLGGPPYSGGYSSAERILNNLINTAGQMYILNQTGRVQPVYGGSGRGGYTVPGGRGQPVDTRDVGASTSNFMLIGVALIAFVIALLLVRK